MVSETNPKGAGRKPAPYKIVRVRLPEAIMPKVKEIEKEFKSFINSIGI